MLPHRRLTLLLSGGLLAATGCADRVPWRSDWQVAMAEARRDGLPILLMFSAALCQRCWHMDQKVFTDERVKEELKTFKLIRVDLLTHADLAKRYEFTGTPSFAILSATGRVLGKHAGALEVAEFIRFVQRSRMNR